MAKIMLNTQKLRDYQEESTIFIKLSVVYNDLTTVTRALSEIKQNNAINNIKIGDSLYFIRLQISIFSEAIAIFKEIKSNLTLYNIVKRTSKECVDMFNKIVKLPEDKPDVFRKRIKDIRDNLVFHYQFNPSRRTNLITQALELNIDSDLEAILSEDIRESRLSYADSIINKIMFNILWGVRESDSTNKEILALIDELNDYIKYFTYSSYEIIQVIANELFAEP